MDLALVRRLAISAIFSDDLLFEQLVLKGGNALSLVHELGSRTSLDVDLSMEKDFRDLAEAQKRAFQALERRFRSAGYAFFDYKFLTKPADANDQWGGYEINFKIIENSKRELIGTDLARAQREATVVGPSQQRVFKVQISKFEYCQGKQEAELDDYRIYVYTLPMIAIEKFRAICQQMDEYPHRAHPTVRARDFYDIYCIVTDGHVDLTTDDNLNLFRDMFAIKEVPLDLIRKIPDYREFHRLDWPSVEASVSGELKSYDFYFDFVIGEKDRLKAFWVE
ncbi:nucleotidyl transferase AbiEii/AbiGii toxin family protein [Acidobacteriia bacterium AH_259_A11_L15]|nr:nucleotidyl transferase AbiEii/AbiGii toxin family protein [Acidobacteriia bacterium AH_259_A11_L15]